MIRLRDQASPYPGAAIINKLQKHISKSRVASQKKKDQSQEGGGGCRAKTLAPPFQITHTIRILSSTVLYICIENPTPLPLLKHGLNEENYYLK